VGSRRSVGRAGWCTRECIRGMAGSQGSVHCSGEVGEEERETWRETSRFSKTRLSQRPILFSCSILVYYILLSVSDGRLATTLQSPRRWKFNVPSEMFLPFSASTASDRPRFGFAQVHQCS